MTNNKLNEKEIKEYLRMLLRRHTEDRVQFINRYLGALSDTVKLSHNLIRDIVIISITIIGFVIPLILNSDIELNKKLLSISIILFVVIIIWGITLLIYRLKDDLNQLPKSLEEISSKINKNINALTVAILNFTEDNVRIAIEEVGKRTGNKEKPKGKIRKIINKFYLNKVINMDTLFYGVFFMAITLFIISIFPFSEFLQIFK